MPVSRVVLIALDGFPHRAVSAALTPRLWRLGQEGGRAPEGGITDLPSSTDPGFCSLLTGCRPAKHGVRTTSWRFAKLPAWAGAQTPQVPTIFDACRAAGVPSAAIMADDRGLLSTDAADYRWPASPGVPQGIALDTHGYPANSEILPRLLERLAAMPDGLILGHFNESDSMGHDFGPESEAARDCYARTDTVVGQVLDGLHGRWSDTIVVVVSDHDMQARDGSTPIDLLADGQALWDLYVPDGGAALVHLTEGADHGAAREALMQVDGVLTTAPGDDRMIVAGAQPGRIFASPRYPAGGFHGAPATARTVAVVGGGHPSVHVLADKLRRQRPHLADWAPTLAPLLGIAMPTAEGVSLLR